MDPVARFGEPVRVSPFLKFCRWSALLLGVTYGLTKNKYLQRKADRYKAVRDVRRATRIQFEKDEKIRINKESQLDLEKILNTKL